MEVTLQNIADILSVSTATVSRSLHHDTSIHPETRARVNEAAQRMGYKARPRRPRRVKDAEVNSRTLGLLIRHNTLESARHDGNLMKMMSGIMAVTEANRMQLQIHTVHHDEKRHMADHALAIPPMAEHGVCQAFIVHGDQDEKDLAFLAERAPVISIGRIYRGLPIDAAVGDNSEGIRALVAHLVELGHRRLVWVGTGISTTFMDSRQSGFIQGCLEHRLEFSPRSFFGPELFEEPHCTVAIAEVLRTGVTGFVCGNDSIASTIIQQLEAEGHHVPRDVSVTGFDAAVNAAKSRQPTSVDPHFFEIGQVAARLAIHRIAHPTTQTCIVSVRSEILSGDTSAAAPKIAIA